jgi:hypothetical protein
LVALLAGYPLRLPPEAIQNLGLVLTLEAWDERHEVRRQARDLAVLRATGTGGVAIDRLASRQRDEAESRLAMDVAARILTKRGLGGSEREFVAEVKRRTAAIRRGVVSTTVDDRSRRSCPNG